MKGKSPDKSNSVWSQGSDHEIPSPNFPQQSSSTEASLSQGEESCMENCDLDNEPSAPSSGTCSGVSEAPFSKDCTTKKDRSVISFDKEMSETHQRTGCSIPCSAGLDSNKVFEPVDSLVSRLCHSEVQSGGENCRSEILSSSTSVSCMSLPVISSISHSNLSGQNGCETDTSQNSDNVQQCYKQYSPSSREDGCLCRVHEFDDRREGNGSLYVSESTFQHNGDARNCSLSELSEPRRCVNKQGRCRRDVSVSSTDNINPEKVCDPDIILRVNCLQKTSPVHPPSMQEQMHSTDTLSQQEKPTSEYANCNGFVGRYSYVRPESSPFFSSVSPDGLLTLTQDNPRLSNSLDCLPSQKSELEHCLDREEFKEISNVTNSCSNESVNLLVTSKEPNKPITKASSCTVKFPNDGYRDKPAINDSVERQSGTGTMPASGQQLTAFGGETNEQNNLTTSPASIQIYSPEGKDHIRCYGVKIPYCTYFIQG